MRAWEQKSPNITQTRIHLSVMLGRYYKNMFCDCAEQTWSLIDWGLVWHFRLRQSPPARLACCFRLSFSLSKGVRWKSWLDRSGLEPGQVLDTCLSCQTAAALQFLLYNSRVFPLVRGEVNRKCHMVYESSNLGIGESSKSIKKNMESRVWIFNL